MGVPVSCELGLRNAWHSVSRKEYNTEGASMAPEVIIFTRYKGTRYEQIGTPVLQRSFCILMRVGAYLWIGNPRA